MLEPPKGNLLHIAEDLSDSPPVDPFMRWSAGFAAAGFLGGYAIRCLLVGEALFLKNNRNGGRGIELYHAQGRIGLAVSLLYLSVAAFMHCHWFWSNQEGFVGYAQIGKIISLLGIIGPLIFLFLHIIVWH